MEDLVTESGGVMGVALNNMLPMDCSMSTVCEEGDSKLTYKNWQKPLVDSAPSLHVLQDLDRVNMWDEVGCGHDDLVIYDAKGRVYQYLPR